jgi:hypothetical protein
MITAPSVPAIRTKNGSGPEVLDPPCIVTEITAPLASRPGEGDLARGGVDGALAGLGDGDLGMEVGHDGRHLRDFAGQVIKHRERVPAHDGEQARALARVGGPGEALRYPAPAQRVAGDDGGDRFDAADPATGDEIADVAHGRRVVALKPDRADDARPGRGGGQFRALFDVGTQRPLAEHVLAFGQGRAHGGGVTGRLDRYDHEVDVVACGQFAGAGEGMRSAEGDCGVPGRRLPRCRHRGDREIVQAGQCGEVCRRGPACSRVRPQDAYPDGIAHAAP